MRLQAVRMLRHVESLVVVYPELQPGDIVVVPAERAAQLANSGVVEEVAEDAEPTGLEAAALRSPRRRG